MSEWINNKKIVDRDAEKPCHVLKYCPYGPLVEEYPLREKRDPKYSCTVFGHDCPVFYQKEGFCEEV